MALGITVAVTVMLLSVERGEFVFNVRGVDAPWLAWASQMADLTRAVPSLFRHGAGVALAEAGVWTAALLAAWLAARFIERAGRLRPGASDLAAVFALGLAVTAAAAATWRIEGVGGTRFTYGQLRALEAAGTRRGFRAVVLDYRAAMGPGLALERAVEIDIAVAGGLDAITAPQASARSADIVIVGGAITRSADVRESARKVREALDEPGQEIPAPVSLSVAGRELFSGVSAPNVSDAMHRKGAMAGIMHLAGGIKMVGKAVTAQSFAGDWAKPVEAIDHAGKGDVLVINNEGSIGIATWGELATLSALSRGIEGVVIDGAVRDIDDIRKLPLPVFARAVVPNAGEPKGFGEINSEIMCGGQMVRPGDWIVGDESGVVVIPKERAYEVARRAREVKKTEERVREEIRRGSTLSRISDLVKWEKK